MAHPLRVRADNPLSTRADGLLHPVPIVAILVLVLNDHWWKYSFTGWATGKISDVAGMVFFPLMLQAMVELADRRTPFRPSRRVLWAAALGTGAVFATTNLFEWAGEVYRVGLGWIQWPFRVGMAWIAGESTPPPLPVQLTADPTDVLAVPFVMLAVWAGWKRCGGTQHA